VLDVLDVQDALTVGPSEAIGRSTDDLHHDDGTFPGRAELVHSLGVLDASQDEIPHVEGPFVHIAFVVTT
jgi:hypothetical protein